MHKRLGLKDVRKRVKAWFHDRKSGAANHSPSNPSSSIRELVRWFFIVPLVVSVLFLCSELGLAFSPRYDIGETGSRLTADYAPWGRRILIQFNERILRELQHEMSADAPDGDQAGSLFASPSGEQGPFVEDTPTPSSAGDSPTQKPTREGEDTPTSTPSPEMEDTLIPTVDPSATSQPGSPTPAPSVTNEPSATATAKPTESASATHTATPTSTITPLPSQTTSGCAWWDTNWNLRRKIIIDNSSQSQELTLYPLLLVLKPANFDYSRARSGGQDLRFVDEDCTSTLDYEIEKWDQTAESCIWIEVPSIKGGSSTDHIWMYYGNSSAPGGENPAGVWERGYEAVWHLHDDFQDSTRNHPEATNRGSSDTEGVVGDGQRFNGSSDYIDTNYSSNYGYNQDFTFEGWFNVGSIRGSDAILGIEDRGGGDESEIRLSVREQGEGTHPVQGLNYWIRPDSHPYFGDYVPAAPSSNVWHYAVLTRQGSMGHLYLDGSEIASGSVSSDGLTFPVTLLIGAQWETDVGGGSIRNQLEGALDEVRTSGVAHSADWVAFSYKMIMQNSTVVTAGPEEVH